MCHNFSKIRSISLFLSMTRNHKLSVFQTLTKLFMIYQRRIAEHVLTICSEQKHRNDDTFDKSQLTLMWLKIKPGVKASFEVVVSFLFSCNQIIYLDFMHTHEITSSPYTNDTSTCRTITL